MPSDPEKSQPPAEDAEKKTPKISSTEPKQDTALEQELREKAIESMLKRKQSSE